MNIKAIAWLLGLMLVVSACAGDSSDEDWTTTKQTDTTNAAAERVEDDRTESTVAGLSDESSDDSADAEWVTGQTAAPREEETQVTDVPDAEFRAEDPNPAIDPIRDSLSTFALDVDTGSYTIGQRYVSDGFLPDPDSVRTEEYVNALNYHYPQPDRSEDFAIYLMGAPAPLVDDADTYLLQVGIQAYDVSDRRRPPANLTFVIDVSGSMSQDNKLETVKDALVTMVDNLEVDDQVAIVAYDTRANVILEPTSVRDADVIIDAIDDLRTGGSTNAEAGLVLGYELAEESYDRNAINRVIFASDGVANVGDTSPEGILGSIAEAAGDGITMVAVGVGMGDYNDFLLEQIADNGDGFYAYVDGYDEIRELFVDDLTGTLLTVAKDAKAQVDFNPDAVLSYRLLGYENRDIADRDFRNDETDAGEIGAGHSVTAIYEVVLTRDATSRDELATVSLRWLDPDNDRASEIAQRIDVADLERSFEDAPLAFKTATTVALYAEVLRNSTFARGLSLRDLVELADDVARQADDRDFDEFADFVYDASRLGR